jgi:probable DNA repair protein
LNPALSSPVGIAGGAAVLRDQAACGFRAFARHRLGGTALASPHAGLDAAERGTLLHQVLCEVWRKLEDHATLSARDEPALAALVGAAVRRAVEGLGASGTLLEGRFAAVEEARLSRLVLQWLAYERERQPFTVVACEEDNAVTLGPLAMRLRIDRLDRLADGTHALIDYKTGQAKLAAWLGERPDEPQLPLYFHTASKPVSVLAYARVKRGERGKVFGFEGVSAMPGAMPDIEPIENRPAWQKRGYHSWDVMAAEWEASLASLAADFARGAVAANPKYGEPTCAICDLHALCRIAAGAVQARTADEAAGSPAGDGRDE